MPGTAELRTGDVAAARRAPRWWARARVVVRDESMHPTLRPGDRLWIDRGAYRSGPPSPGDLVVLTDPAEPARWLVKRVAVVGPAPGPPEVPAGTVFVRADGDGPVRDSRSFGPVPIGRLVGRVYRRYFPPERRAEL
jgi:signal peptidase I